MKDEKVWFWFFVVFAVLGLWLFPELFKPPRDWRSLSTHAKCAECGHVQRMMAGRAIWLGVKDDCEECGAEAVGPYKRI
jgi:predicted RNA-binding Zn-ribbon protein involved in translation (DUF1610 family)